MITNDAILVYRACGLVTISISICLSIYIYMNGWVSPVTSWAFFLCMKSVSSCEYDRWVVDTQLRKLRDMIIQTPLLSGICVFFATVLKVPVAHANSTIILTVYAGVRITTVHIICVLTVEIRWWHVFVVCRSCVGKFPVTMWVIQYIVLNIVTWPNLSGCNMSRWKC